MRNAFHLLALIAVLFVVPVVYETPEGHREEMTDAAAPPSAEYTEVRSFLESRMDLGEVPFDELTRTILTAAARADLEPRLIVGLIHVESSGNPHAVSRVGALGLMQLLPATAEAMAAELDIAWEGDESLFEPNTNVRLGIHYLGKLVTRFDDLDTALAAYNWGPTHIARVIRKGSAVPVRYTESVHRARVAMI